MVAQRYNRPPIVEAVIDLKIGDVLSERDMERLRDRFKRAFPAVEDRKTIQVQAQLGQFTTNVFPAGFKLSAQNGIDVVLINPDSFGSVRLAPYESWEDFAGFAKDNFEAFLKVVGRKRIIRVGVRFINRLDIPNSDFQGGKAISEFVCIGVSLPNIASETGTYSIAINGVEASTGAKFILQSSTIDPPALLDHTSIALDIDAYWDNDIPMRIEDMWSRTEVLRQAKNAIFEACITDKSRARFQ